MAKVKAEPPTPRAKPSLANFKEAGIILATGGMQPGFGGLLSSVDLYDVTNDAWSTGPPLNRKRLSHTSCCIANFAYVSCG